MQNDPLLFINSPIKINNDKGQTKFDSRKKIITSFDDKINDLLSHDKAKITVEIKLKNLIYEGIIKDYQNGIIELFDDLNIYFIDAQKITEINLIKIEKQSKRA